MGRTVPPPPSALDLVINCSIEQPPRGETVSGIVIPCMGDVFPVSVLSPCKTANYAGRRYRRQIGPSLACPSVDTGLKDEHMSAATRRWIVALAVPALLALAFPRLRAEVNASASDGVIDKYDVTEDDVRMRRFAELIGAMDDALRVNAIDRYAGLNRRLREMMQQVVQRTAGHVAELKSRRSRDLADGILRAEMNDWIGNAVVDPVDPGKDNNPGRSARLAARRLEEMKQIIEKTRRLDGDIRQGTTAACVKNAALADRFLALMKAERVSRLRER